MAQPSESGLYASYKGWKPFVWLRLVVGAFCLYASYKGWKLGTVISGEKYRAGLYASYKGWKLSCLHPLESCNSMFICFL